MRLPLRSSAFTVVELLIVVTVVAVLASITIIAFSGIQHRADDARTLQTLTQATKVLDVYFVDSEDYPPNLAGTSYVAPEEVALALYTNAPQKRVHTNLSSDQNAQLLLNSCNARMPVEENSTTYNTGCMFSGRNFHVKGKRSSNVVLSGPTIDRGDFQLTCGPACGQAQQAILEYFTDQGGTFPIDVPRTNVTIPPAELTAYGSATNFCLEARSVTYDDIVYHTTHQDSRPLGGSCPEDSDLHYP